MSILPYQDPSPHVIERGMQRLACQIKTAFADVTLDGGVGYFEAYALDGYVPSTDADYAVRVQKDRSTTWLELAETALQDGYCGIAALFLDVKGLHYFLPVSLLLDAGDSTMPDNLFEPWGQPRTDAMLALLTPAQWEALIDHYLFYADWAGWVSYWRSADPGSPGTACASCGKIHAWSKKAPRAALTLPEAQAKADAQLECHIWRQLQAAYLQAHPLGARAYLDSPRAESRQHFLEEEPH